MFDENGNFGADGDRSILYRVAVKTDKRGLTAEETADRLQGSVARRLAAGVRCMGLTLLYSGIMKGWKNSTFSLPWALAKGSHLGASCPSARPRDFLRSSDSGFGVEGSSHDKKREDWENKRES